MRRYVLSVASGLLAMAAVPSVAAAANAEVTTDLNMRAGPSTSFPVVDVLPDDADVTVHGCVRGYQWCDVTWRGARGWVYAAYLRYYYRERYVPLVEYATVIDVPIIGFSVDTYWDTYYRDRPWYGRRDRWRSVWRERRRDFREDRREDRADRRRERRENRAERREDRREARQDRRREQRAERRERRENRAERRERRGEGRAQQRERRRDARVERRQNRAERREQRRERGARFEQRRERSAQRLEQRRESGRGGAQFRERGGSRPGGDSPRSGRGRDG